MSNINPELTTPLDGGEKKFSVTTVRGKAIISEHYLYSLSLESLDPAVDFEALVGKNVTLSLAYMDTKKVFINGIISKMMLGSRAGGHTAYYAELRPKLWELTLTRDCRIFQNMSVIDIITKITGEFQSTI